MHNSKELQLYSNSVPPRSRFAVSHIRSTNPFLGADTAAILPFSNNSSYGESRENMTNCRRYNPNDLEHTEYHESQENRGSEPFLYKYEGLQTRGNESFSDKYEGVPANRSNPFSVFPTADPSQTTVVSHSRLPIINNQSASQTSKFSASPNAISFSSNCSSENIKSNIEAFEFDGKLNIEQFDQSFQVFNEIRRDETTRVDESTSHLQKLAEGLDICRSYEIKSIDRDQGPAAKTIKNIHSTTNVTMHLNEDRNDNICLPVNKIIDVTLPSYYVVKTHDVVDSRIESIDLHPRDRVDIEKYGDRSERIKKSGDRSERIKKSGDRCERIKKSRDRSERVNKSGDRSERVQKSGSKSGKDGKTGDRPGKDRKTGHTSGSVHQAGSRSRMDEESGSRSANLRKLNSLDVDLNILQEPGGFVYLSLDSLCVQLLIPSKSIWDSLLERAIVETAEDVMIDDLSFHMELESCCSNEGSEFMEFTGFDEISFFSVDQGMVDFIEVEFDVDEDLNLRLMVGIKYEEDSNVVVDSVLIDEYCDTYFELSTSDSSCSLLQKSITEQDEVFLGFQIIEHVDLENEVQRSDKLSSIASLKGLLLANEGAVKSEKQCIDFGEIPIALECVETSSLFHLIQGRLTSDRGSVDAGYEAIDNFDFEIDVEVDKSVKISMIDSTIGVESIQAGEIVDECYIDDVNYEIEVETDQISTIVLDIGSEHRESGHVVLSNVSIQSDESLVTLEKSDVEIKSPSMNGTFTVDEGHVVLSNVSIQTDESLVTFEKSDVEIKSQLMNGTFTVDEGFVDDEASLVCGTCLCRQRISRGTKVRPVVPTVTIEEVDVDYYFGAELERGVEMEIECEEAYMHKGIRDPMHHNYDGLAFNNMKLDDSIYFHISANAHFHTHCHRFNDARSDATSNIVEFDHDVTSVSDDSGVSANPLADQDDLDAHTDYCSDHDFNDGESFDSTICSFIGSEELCGSDEPEYGIGSTEILRADTCISERLEMSCKKIISADANANRLNGINGGMMCSYCHRNVETIENIVVNDASVQVGEHDDAIPTVPDDKNENCELFTNLGPFVEKYHEIEQETDRRNITASGQGQNACREFTNMDGFARLGRELDSSKGLQNINSSFHTHHSISTSIFEN